MGRQTSTSAIRCEPPPWSCTRNKLGTLAERWQGCGITDLLPGDMFMWRGLVHYRANSKAFDALFLHLDAQRRHRAEFQFLGIPDGHRMHVAGTPHVYHEKRRVDFPPGISQVRERSADGRLSIEFHRNNRVLAIAALLDDLSRVKPAGAKQVERRLFP